MRLSGVRRGGPGKYLRSWVCRVPWHSVFDGVLGMSITATKFAPEVVKFCCKCVCVENSVSEVKGYQLERLLQNEKSQVQSLWCVGRWNSVVCVVMSGWGCVRPRQFVRWWLWVVFFPNLGTVVTYRLLSLVERLFGLHADGCICTLLSVHIVRHFVFVCGCSMLL